MPNFNFSYSALGTYLGSQLQFYFAYVIKAKPSDNTISCYGDVGNVIHDTAEAYMKDEDYYNVFETAWEDKKLSTTNKAFRGKLLDKNKYIVMLNNLKNFVDKNSLKKCRFETEKLLEFYDKKHNIKIKGYIDLIVNKDNKIYLYDWKTNSSADYSTHMMQRLFYSWLCWKIYNIIPEECIWVYVNDKIKDEDFKDKFNLDDIKSFDKYINKILDEIISKGEDINKYELGEYDNIFNSHKSLCVEEKERRKNKNKIVIKIKDNKLYLENFPAKLLKALDITFSYYEPGYNWSELYKKRLWDGKKHFLKNNILPYGFIKKVISIYEEYNKYYNLNIKLHIIDCRTKKILEHKYNTAFKKSKIKLRDYQEVAIESAINNKIGIIAIGTGGGKSIIAAEVIKRLNKRTLFLVNRLELLTQTKEVFENYLGVSIGEMSEGNLCIDKQIVVASIQTLDAILKRNDDTSYKLKLYLHNISTVIYDEAQNLIDSGMYGRISRHLTNNNYFIALSGSPWRAAGDTLEMNALCGFPIYTKTTKELEKEGYLVPTDCYFIKMNHEESYEDYQEEYTQLIVNNEKRNYMIVKIAEKFRKNKKILIITRRVKHAEILGKLIPNSFVITGGTDKDVRKESYKLFKENSNFILIGSSRIFSCGIDIPNLDVIINATAHKSTVESIQIVGRVKRKSDGKIKGYFIDFFDNSNYLINSSNERIKILKKFGNEVKTASLIDEIK